MGSQTPRNADFYLNIMLLLLFWKFDTNPHFKLDKAEKFFSLQMIDTQKVIPFKFLQLKQI